MAQKLIAATAAVFFLGSDVEHLHSTISAVDGDVRIGKHTLSVLKTCPSVAQLITCGDAPGRCHLAFVNGKVSSDVIGRVGEAPYT
jgi:hypothetical protein